MVYIYLKTAAQKQAEKEAAEAEAAAAAARVTARYGAYGTQTSARGETQRICTHAYGW